MTMSMTTGVTALIQVAVVALSSSVALLGDTLHNAADALTAVPLGVAFVVGRRPPTRRFTYGFGRAEGLAGIAIVLTIAASSAPGLLRGHQLRAECEMVVAPDITAIQAHQITVAAEHGLLHAMPRLSAALVHADPLPHDGADLHQALASHR